jgi:tetratricopeptide (TPR) repeat protein
MYNIIPLIIVLVCLVIVIAIVIRRLPQLAILDVENMPAEKEGKIKEQIIKKRLERDMMKWTARLFSFGKDLGKRFNFLFNWLDKLSSIKNKYREERHLAKISKHEKIAILLTQAKEAIKREETADLNLAESKLIEVVSLDNKNLEAFMELADVYLKLKKYFEARQTYQYCLKLIEFKDDKRAEAEINYSLYVVNENLDNLDEAWNNIIESLKIEPNNPRFLDAMLDLCILRKDKALAIETLARLEEVNPENNKVGEWKEKIENL